MTRKTSSYHESLLEALTDPVEAAEYLNAALEDSPESFLKAVGNVAQARQMTKVAKDAGIQRETMYRSFSTQGNPTFTTLSAVLRAVGLKIVIGTEEEEVSPSSPFPLEFNRRSPEVIEEPKEERIPSSPFDTEGELKDMDWMSLLVAKGNNERAGAVNLCK